jgi:hypothetical protein
MASIFNFVEGRPWTTGSGIAQLAAGGQTSWITTTLQEAWTIFGISPDRSELLVANGAGVGAYLLFPELWVQPLPEGAPHRVGNQRFGCMLDSGWRAALNA